jgi:predicted O-methyltransferase YrrM
MHIGHAGANGGAMIEKPAYTFSTDYVSSFTEQWALCLRDLAGRADVRMLEIGSFEGRSAIWFLENILTGLGSSITCVDGFWPPYGDVFDRNIAASGLSARVIKRRGPSQEVLPTLARASFDAMYIDGGHREEQVWADARHCWRLGKAGAILIFDDYEWEPHLPLEDRPRRAIDRFLRKHAGKYELMQRGYQVTVRKQPGLARRNFFSPFRNRV